MCNSIWFWLRSSAMHRNLKVLKRVEVSKAVNKKSDTALFKLHHMEESMTLTHMLLHQIRRKLMTWRM